VRRHRAFRLAPYHRQAPARCAAHGAHYYRYFLERALSEFGNGEVVMSKGDSSQGGWPFKGVLIANRGEIALRILRTVQALGLEAVVVHHAADSGSPAVAAADRAIEITGATPIAAYLDGVQIVAAARAGGAGAIHPGYGFLSENAHF